LEEQDTAGQDTNCEQMKVAKTFDWSGESAAHEEITMLIEIFHIF